MTVVFDRESAPRLCRQAWSYRAYDGTGLALDSVAAFFELDDGEETAAAVAAAV